MGCKSRFAAWGVLWLLLAAIAMSGGVSAMETALPNAEGRVSCRYDGEGPSLETVEILRAAMAQSAEDGKAEGGVVAWAQTPKTEVAVEAMGSSIEVDALWVDGEAQRIWPWKALTGTLPVFGTARVCALDKGTALTLFGSVDIVGQSVDIGGISYEVVCVFELPQGLAAWTADPGNGLALCPAAAPEEPLPFQALDFEVMPLDAKSPKEWAEAWLSESRAPTPNRTDALWQQKRLLALAAGCGPAVMVLCILWALSKAALGLLRETSAKAQTCWSNRSCPASHGWRVWGLGLFEAGMLVGVAVWAIHLAQIHLDVPPDYLPTRWSDLSFWPTLAKESAQEYAARKMMGALRPDMVRGHLHSMSAWLSLAAVPFLGMAWHGLRQSARPGTSLPRITVVLLCGTAVVPLALWCMQGVGFPTLTRSGLLPLLLIFTAVAQLAQGNLPAKLLTYLNEKQEEVSL